MFRKVHLKLTMLFTVVSSLILVVMSLLFLFVQTRNLHNDTENKFRQNLDSFLYSFENNNIVTYDWLKSIENNYGYDLYPYDNSVPMRFLQDTKSEEKLRLINQVRESCKPVDTGKNSAEIMKYSSDSESYHVGIISLCGDRSTTEIYVLLSLEQTEKQLLVMYVQFGIIILLGIILLLCFSWIFTKKLLKPIQESQQQQTAFIAAASHEIRNPVNTMLSALDAMENAEGLQKKEFLSIAKKEGKRLTFLTNDLLTLARSDNRSMPMSFSKAELDTIVLECYEAFLQPAREKQIILSVSLMEESLVAEHTDGERIRQVVSILLDNAISYTPEHGKIQLRCERIKTEIVISVSDNGSGLSDEQKLHVFDRFYRGDVSRHSKEHFGLGLSIAKEIVDLHCGRITVEDNIGGGTIFRIWIKAR